jgi:hypothetical protein
VRPVNFLEKNAGSKSYGVSALGVGEWGMVMAASFVVALIVGVLLGLRFKVFVLVSATLMAAAVAIVVSGHQPKVTMVVTVLGVTVLLQIGYVIGFLVGLVIRTRLQRRTMARFHRSPFNE